MLGETVYWLFVFVSVETAWVVVGVLLPKKWGSLFTDHLSLLVVEKLKCIVIISQPWVAQDLRDSQPFVWVDFEQASQQVSAFLGDIFFQGVHASQN